MANAPVIVGTDDAALIVFAPIASRSSSEPTRGARDGSVENCGPKPDRAATVPSREESFEVLRVRSKPHTAHDLEEYAAQSLAVMEPLDRAEQGRLPEGGATARDL
jgi:hypothetical protein